MLTLPIDPKTAVGQIIVPAIQVLGSRFDSPSARVQLLAIALQESGLAHRAQIGGPARGLWQFEMGGCRGVLSHPASTALATKVARDMCGASTADAVYDDLSQDDILACCMARLLLWTDPQPLPVLGDVDAAWGYYKRNWRPGRPRPEHWPDNYRLAMGAVQ